VGVTPEVNAEPSPGREDGAGVSGLCRLRPVPPEDTAPGRAAAESVATEDPGGPTLGVNYVLWALVGMASYTMVAPLMKVALTDVPSDVAVLLSNLILVAVAGGLVVVSDTNVSGFLTHSKVPYVYTAGLFLAVGILAYYRALSLGPVSVVVPVFAMFIVTSSAAGVVLLDETLTLRRGAGIALAIVAVYLTATG
jgi:transporter family protein